MIKEHVWIPYSDTNSKCQDCFVHMRDGYQTFFGTPCFGPPACSHKYGSGLLVCHLEDKHLGYHSYMTPIGLHTARMNMLEVIEEC